MRMQGVGGSLRYGESGFTGCADSFMNMHHDVGARVLRYSHQSGTTEELEPLAMCYCDSHSEHQDPRRCDCVPPQLHQGSAASCVMIAIPHIYSLGHSKLWICLPVQWDLASCDEFTSGSELTGLGFSGDIR